MGRGEKWQSWAGGGGSRGETDEDVPLAALWAALERALGQVRCQEERRAAGSIPVVSDLQAVPPSNPELPPVGQGLCYGSMGQRAGSSRRRGKVGATPSSAAGS